MDQILLTAGVTTNWVLVLPAKKTVAFAVGGSLPNLDVSLFGFSYKGTVAAGVICVDEAELKSFLYDEIRFILAHECFHILKNHLATRAIWEYVRKALEGERRKHAVEVALLEAAFVVLGKERLPPNVQTSRDQEYEADELAIRLTGNQDAAIRSLAKLVGGNMSLPSHKWELFGTDLPMMTMGERIQELKKRTGIFFPSFPKF